MNDHVTADVLVDYAMGTLDAASMEVVEAHVEICPRCLAELQREARLECGLYDVAAALPRDAVVRLPNRRRWSTRVALGAGLAVAAGLVLALGGAFTSAPTTAPEVRYCNAPDVSADCLARARFDGLLSVGPREELVVPRYEIVPSAVSSGGPR
jgi:anti-sigma factor RsiW